MKTLTLTLTLLALAPAAQAQPDLNQMTLVGQYEGEASDDRFGGVMTMGDFDADGFDEFIIGASGWNNLMSKNYYYDWNSNWPITPVWTMQGTQELHSYDLVDKSIGDVSGDGIDDFGIVELRMGEVARFDLLFGASNFDSLPDWSMWSGEPVTQFGGDLDSCGDINGDGGIDFLMQVWSEVGPGSYYQTRIYYGGAVLDSIADWTICTGTDYQKVQGLGDVNADGFADILMEGINSEPPLLFFGGNPMDTIPDLVFYDWSPGAGGGLGDINGDEYNDFILDLKLPDSTAAQINGYVYLGGPEVDNIFDEILQDRFGNLYPAEVVCKGNFNGDDYGDFAIGGAGDLVFGRVVYIYLGSPWFNPVPDAMVADWVPVDGFGDALATGDVNGDGRDEILVGSPLWLFPFEQGRAYLYTGPEQWIDYGAGVNPEELPRMPGWFRLDQNYPNPFNSSTSIHFELGKPSSVNLTVYDLQGQRIKAIIAHQQMLPGGYNVSWNGKNDHQENISSGIYLLQMQVDQYQQIKKIALLR